MTANKFIQTIKADCEHNLRELDKVLHKDMSDFQRGMYQGMRNFDSDLLEQIDEWEHSFSSTSQVVCDDVK